MYSPMIFFGIQTCFPVMYNRNIKVIKSQIVFLESQSRLWSDDVAGLEYSQKYKFPRVLQVIKQVNDTFFMFVFIFVSLLGKLREYRAVVFVACDIYHPPTKSLHFRI
jgi:hypothetical protein